MKRAALISCIVLAAGCAAEGLQASPDAGADAGPSVATQIDQYVEALADLPADPPKMMEGTKSAPATEGDYSCTTQNFSETRQYDKIVALSANSESLWPGAVLAGDSVYTGLFTQIVLPRAPLDVSISLESLAGAKSMTMDQPSLSQFRDGMTGVLSSTITGATPANLYSEVEQVHSEQQLTLALGASVAYAGAKVAASFNFDDHTVLSRYVVKYTQAYYTVDVDQPEDAAALFAKSVSLGDLKAKVGPGNPPVYVSSITYGRMVIFTFESKYSGEEMGAALDFAYKGGVDVSGDVSVKYKDIISSSKITAFILGGSGGDAAQSIDSYDALIAFIKKGGNYSKDSPGAPIAYKLAYLKDNSPARLSFTTDYSVKECVRVGQQILVTLKSIKVDSAGGDAGSDLELYGNIAATSRPKGGANLPETNIFTRDSSHYVSIKEGETWPQSGVIASQIIDVVPQPGSVLTLSAWMMDYDPIGSDDNICNDSVALSFEQGWNQDVPIYCTGSSARVIVTLNVKPI